MKQKTQDHRIIVRYLLGELAEKEQIRLEEQYFTDDSWFEQLLAVEEELIDDYVQGQLSRRERERFEKHFLTTPKRRERVEFAKALQQYAAEEQKESAPASAALSPQSESWWRSILNFLLAPHPMLQPAFATAVVVMMLGSAWLFVQTKRLQDQLAQFEVERAEGLERRRGLQQQTDEQREQSRSLQQQIDEQREQSRKLTQELENEKRLRVQLEQKLSQEQATQTIAETSEGRIPITPEQPAAVSFALSAGALRDVEGAKKLRIPRNAEVVQLQPDFEDGGEYQSYRAVLKTAEGEEVWSQSLLQARVTDAGKIVVLNIPVLVFGENDYILMLIGVTAAKETEVVGNYPFSVIRK